MKLKDIGITAMERMEEFLDGTLDKIAGKDNRLKADFTRPSKLMSSRNKGFSVTGNKYLTVEQSRKNMIVVAPSGGGKSTVVSYPTILNIANAKDGNSMLINDPSGELIKTRNYLLQQGYQVKVLDFGNAYGSIYYNPLQRIRTNADVMKVASMLVRATSKDSDFWTLSATQLIALCIHHLRATEPRVYQNLANVYRILETLAGEPEVVDAYFADTTPKHLWRKFLSIMGNSENTRASIISSAQAALSFVGEDDILCAITSTDTINFGALRQAKTAIFLRCPMGDVQYYSTILSIFWEQYFSEVFRNLPSVNDKDVFVILDELSSLHLPNFSNIISNARKFKIPILGVLQSENQLFNNYGIHNGKTILNNANVKVYFTGLSDESRSISDTLGTFEYEDDNGSRRVRNLMMPNEVRTMSPDQVLVVPSGMEPIKIKAVPFYRQPKMVGYMGMEAPRGLVPYDLVYTAQYIDLDRYRGDNDQTPQGNEI